MPQIVLPSLKEVIKDPTLLKKLPADVAWDFVQQGQDLLKNQNRDVFTAADPLSLALRYPRFQWLDAPHLHMASKEVAHTIASGDAQMFFMPPRHCKSTLVSGWTPFYALTKDPELPILLLSGESRNATKWGRYAKQLVEAYGAEFGLRIASDKQATDNWELETGGGMMSLSVGSAIAGKPARLLILDDVVTETAAYSKVERDNLKEWWDNAVQQRIEPGTAIFVVGTRYHEDDLYGWLIKESESGNGVYFNVTSLPALAEEDDPLGRPVDTGLWMPKFPQKFYEAKRRTSSPRTWESVYQQHPTPPSGNMVDPLWWRFYTPGGPGDPGKYDQEIQSWDLALDGTAKTDSHYCGGVVRRKGYDIYIPEAFHEHCDITKVIDRAVEWQRTYKGAVQKVIERSLAGPAMVSLMRHKLRAMIAWPPKGRQKSSKEALLTACIPDIRANHIYLPVDQNGNKPLWVIEFIEEFRTFPGAATGDDYVDMFTQAMDFLFPELREHQNLVDEDQDSAFAHDLAREMTGDDVSNAASAHHRVRLHDAIKKIASSTLKRTMKETGQDDPNWIEIPGTKQMSDDTMLKMQSFMEVLAGRKMLS